MSSICTLGFAGAMPEATGRPAYHPATLLRIYLYGYLNRVPSSRRLERESQRNIELIWLTGRLMPDVKTLADFRKDNGSAIQAACAQFVVPCRRLNLFSKAIVAIDGSKFKAVNNRDKNFTAAKVEARMAQVEASIGRYLAALDRADREPSDIAEARTTRLREKIAGLREQMQVKAIMGGMPELARTSVGLRIFGDTLDPDEITRLLGVEPTSCARKGDTHRTESGREVVARSGSWRLDAGLPGNLNTQISALLTNIPSDPVIWRELSKHYECDVFCGLFMRENNEGTHLSPLVMSMLFIRGLRLGLDIYGGSD